MTLLGDTKSIDHESQTRFRSAALLVIALALLGLIGTFAQTDAANPPLNPANVSEPSYPDIPGVIDNYPPIVAYVDGHPIWGELLAIRVNALEQSPNPNFDQSRTVRDALHDVIRDRILLDHASDYGVIVSYNEARAEAQREKARMLSAPVPAIQADITRRAQQMKLSVDGYFDSPEIIQAYRDEMVLGEMQQYILRRSAITPPRSEAQIEAALDAFTAHIHAKVQILVDVP